ncbi:MAG TPA: hypothetical protein PLH94_10965 [Fimbriimonadaceae bacterium]|nr:hypothetical protein [Fimbriimonadaceae bacterium]
MIAPRFVAGLFCASLALAASAGPQSYAQTTSTIRAGVLLTESQRTGPLPGLPNGTPLNPTPHVWGNLDADRTAKPAGWSFVNPRASTTLTQSLRTRWVGLAGAAPGAGVRLTKRHAPYWEVSLANTTDDVLADYDVLLLPIQTNLSLNPLERERLRRYIDQGGVLWVDVLPTANFIDPANPTPLPFSLRLSGAAIDADLSSPLFNFPNTVSLQDLSLMQFGGTNLIGTVNLNTSGLSGKQKAFSWIEPDSLRYESVAGNTDGSMVAIGQIGDGYMVVTTRGISQNLNRGFAGGTVVANIGFESSGPLADISFTAAAKLVCNATNLGSGFRALAKGSRKLFSSNVDLPAPLLGRFSAEIVPQTQPVIAGGRVIVVSNGRLVVLDANPSIDQDGDSNPDDGIPDIIGSSADRIWQSQPLNGPVSTPVVVDVPDASLDSARPGFKATRQILITNASGAVQIFDLDSPPGPNVTALASITPPDAAVIAGSDGPYSPTVHEGLAFVADTRSNGNSGRVWAIDLASSSRLATPNDWAIFGSPRFGEPSNAPTVGYIPIADNSGGVDRVIYVPTRPTSGIGSKPAGIVSLWVGARGESPAGFDAQTPGVLRVTTRASLQGLPVFLPNGSSSLGVKVSVLDQFGNPLTAVQLNALFDGTVSQPSNGELNFGLSSAWPLNATVRIDYTIDWSQLAPSIPADLYIRGNLEVPDDTGNSRKILGSVALSARGYIFLAAGDASRGGGLYCLKEEGRGEFKLLYRWELFDDISFNVNITPGGPAQAIDYRAAVVDEDWLVTNFLAFLNGPIRNLRFTSGPTVKGDTVYIVAGGNKNFFNSPISTLLAFKANPQPVEIDVQNIGSGFTIVQPDMARSTNKTNPDVFSALQPAQYSVEPTGSGSRIRFNNMMSTTRGRMRDSLSTSLPIILRRGGQPDILVEPELGAEDGAFVPGSARGRWSPLLWYMTFNGNNATGQPLVAGDTLYTAGTSFLPSIFVGQFPPTPRGFVFGMDAKASPSDQFMKPISGRPWVLQFNQVQPDPSQSIGFRSNPSIRWPQVKGVESFDDLRVRYLQAAIPDSSALGVVGGDGTLITWSSSRMYAFTRAEFLIADEGRVSRFDQAGNPLWTTDSSANAGPSVPVGGAAEAIGLSNPHRVYSGGDNTYWIVDSGNDRIIRVDSAGRELRTIKGFRLDPKLAPSGFQDNESLTLRKPKDVLVYQTYQNNPTRLTNPRSRELWIHYVIADTGNFRLLELVDRYEVDPATGRIIGPVQYLDPVSGANVKAFGVLVWHSPAELTGKQYAYNSISRTFALDNNGNSRPIFAFGFGNFEPGRTSFGLDTPGNPQVDIASGLGGIVLLDPAGSTTELITQIEVPAIPVNAFYVDSAGTFSSPARAARTQKIAGLSSVTIRYVDQNGTPALAVMFTDATGVYEVIDTNPNPTQSTWTVRWMLPNEAGRVIRRNGAQVPSGSQNAQFFRATFARRLDSGDVIVVNGYYGRTRNNLPFAGEVVLLDGDFGGANNEPGFGLGKVNLGFNSLSVKFELPPVTGTRPLSVPVFADRK